MKDFWNGQKEIKVLDPNITACREKRDLMRQYRETGAWIDFTQGIDIRLTNDEDIDDLNNMKIKRLHFAWDNPDDDLEDRFRRFSEKSVIQDYRRKMVYCLTNFENVSEQEHVERILSRIYRLRDLGFDPYCMIYNKPSAPKVLRDIQRWCNSKVIFKSCPRFEDYRPNRRNDILRRTPND